MVFSASVFFGMAVTLLIVIAILSVEIVGLRKLNDEQRETANKLFDKLLQKHRKVMRVP